MLVMTAAHFDCILMLCRGGLVAPWTAVPALVALSTDPQRDVGDASLRLMRQLVSIVLACADDCC